MAMGKVLLLDTTLRDGEQSAGIGMTGQEKMEIARQLQRMNVDIIEAGFAASSPGDFEAVSNIAKEIKGPIIASLARAVANDVDQAWRSVEHSERPRIHVFLSSSEIHQMHQLRKNREEVMEMAVTMVERAKGYCDDVEFSPMDATRTNPEYLFQMLSEVIKAGATTINIADTVGYAIPSSAGFGQLLKDVQANVQGIENVVLSVHCHNDLGLAVANSLAAVTNGARQVECTINGLGERAGNAALEEIVMAVKTRADFFHIDTNINTREIVPASRLVSSITGFPVQPNKAIVGANAFAHESGIHQDGVIKFRETYEIMKAEDVGWNANRMVLGKHSGRNAFRSRLEELGIDLKSEQALNDAFQRFKDLADKKHEIFDEDIQALVSDTQKAAENEQFALVSLAVCSQTGEIPNASIVLTIGGEEQRSSSEGAGPVDATFKAIERIVNSGTSLELYNVSAITSGTDSQGEVTVRLEKGGRIVNGHGSDIDIVAASAKAYLNALNLLSADSQKAHPQTAGV